MREISETFETIEFFAFREAILFISYSLVFLGIYYLVESLSPSISYPIFFGAWFVFLLLYGLAGIGAKGFILERHMYPTIVSTVFGYGIISTHGAPVLIGESLLRSFVRFPVAFPLKRRFWFHKKEKKYI